MKARSYILISLVIFATSAPTLALAQYERVEGGQPDMTILTIFSLTLYVTIFAIFSVVGHSIWKVFSIRQRAAKLRIK